MSSSLPVLGPLLLAYAGFAGVVIGSYLNVVVYRLPRSHSTVLPRSRCPHCDALISARDNIPVLSFLLLRGKCRSCAAPISWRYPAVELLTGGLFMTVLLRFGWSVESLVVAAFCAAMLVLALIDAEHYLLPDAITLPGIVLGLALQHWLPWSSLGQALIGAFLVAGTLLALTLAWRALRGVDGLGLGDVKMLALVGAFFGWRGAMATLLVAALVGSTFGLAMMARGRMRLDSRLPFGLFLALAAVLVLFWGLPLEPRAASWAGLP